ncbi:NAD(+)/NADH kinase [uncultured Alistipes sp.]|uniref:NAD(+)/NADH kinase n=1 Tax=uncultured Alistipes sp. TaxID=538949 RepID=UPI00260E654D|nr:NAD(+)/NADH kinase [uncultured Alistipes sp.]
MRILLFSRSRDGRAPEGLLRLTAAIDRHGFEWAANREIAEAAGAAHSYGERVGPAERADLMICYGGDGTLLEGVHRLGGAPIPVLGINAGHLGFLTGAPSGDLDTLFDRLAAGDFSVEPRTMLRVEGDFGAEPASKLALNEFTIQRHGAEMISVETYVDAQMVATYHGDGVIVSTPTGSTAYALSAGGPVVAPTCSCLVLSPLAPHNLTMRPVVIPDTARIELRLRARRAEGFVTLDNRAYPAGAASVFTVRRAEERILLALPHNISFYDTLRNKMMWGIDLRS